MALQHPTLGQRVASNQDLVRALLIVAAVIVLMIVLTMAQKETALSQISAMALLSALIGANYGANLSLFPSVTKDYYGLKNFGLNYGLVFTAWGIGGFALSKLQDWLFDSYKTYHYSCYIAAGLLVLAALMSFLLKKPEKA